MLDFSSYQFGFPEVVLLFAIMQTLLMAMVLLAAPGRTPVPNRLLSAFLLLLALALAEFVLVKAGILERYPQLLGFSLPAYYCLAPLYFLYSSTLTGETLRSRDLLHILPLLAGMLLTLPYFLSPAPDKLAVLQQLTGGSFERFPVLAVMLLSLISFQTIVYFYLAYERLQACVLSTQQVSSSFNVMALEWLKKLSAAFCVFVMAFYLVAGELFFFYPYRLHLLGPDLLAYGIAGFVFLVSWHIQRRPELFALYTPGVLQPANQPKDERAKYEKTQLSAVQLAAYEQRLLAYMDKERPWLDGELRMSDLAQALDMPPHHLSQVINVTQQLSFFDFINRHRVRYAVLLLEQAEGKANLLEIALDSGFNSKASFNRVFRKVTGQTPSDYLKQVKKQDSARHLAR